MKVHELRATNWTLGSAEAKPRRPRRTTLDRALREAAKAGVSIKGATVEPDGTIGLQFGQSEPKPDKALDQWIAKRHAH